MNEWWKKPKNKGKKEENPSLTQTDIPEARVDVVDEDENIYLVTFTSGEQYKVKLHFESGFDFDLDDEEEGDD
jgi:hypothetical protein